MIKRLAALTAGLTAAVAAAWAAIGLRRRSRAARRAQRRRARGVKAIARTQQGTPPVGRASAGAKPTSTTKPSPTPNATTQHDAASVAPAVEASSLQSIKGIGGVAEERLRALGVTSVGQIASWSDEDVDRVASQLRVSAERIRREDWVGQAKAMRPTG